MHNPIPGSWEDEALLLTEEQFDQEVLDQCKDYEREEADLFYKEVLSKPPYRFNTNERRSRFNAFKFIF